MIGKLPTENLPEASRSAERASPAPRHYEILLDVGNALGVASAAHSGRFGSLIEHLCLGCVTDRIATAAPHRLTAIVAIDRCHRECIRCERELARRAATVGFVG